jgi:hypothetical protein
MSSRGRGSNPIFVIPALVTPHFAMAVSYSKSRTPHSTHGLRTLALHFELHKCSVPISGGVLPIWFSNVQAARGEIPSNLLAMLPPPRTMKQGTQHVGDQFQYSWTTTDDRNHILVYAVFRQSFAIAATIANDRTEFLDKWKGRHRVFAPGEVRDPKLDG